MQNLARSFTLVLLTLLGALGADSRPVVKIGIVTPLSGNVAHIGEGFRNAALMARDSRPGTKFRYEFLFEDDQLTPAKTIVAANKLIHVDKVRALVSTWGICGTVVSPLTEKTKTIHFGVAWGREVAKGRYNFVHYTQPDNLAERYGRELKKRNLLKVAVLTPNDFGAVQMLKAMEAAFPKMGIQLTAREIVGIDGRDFRTTISKLAQTKPDTFSILLFSPALEIAGRQFKEAGLLNKLTCIGEFGISQEPKLFEGLWYVDGAVGNEAFLKDYNAQYKKIPTNEAPYVYDIVNMLIQACENFPGPAAPAADQIADYLQSLPGYDGVVGHIKPDADGCFISQSVVKMIRNGQPVVIEN